MGADLYVGELVNLKDQTVHAASVGVSVKRATKSLETYGLELEGQGLLEEGYWKPMPTAQKRKTLRELLLELVELYGILRQERALRFGALPWERLQQDFAKTGFLWWRVT